MLAVKVERDRVARAKRSVAARRVDAAAVADLAAQQGHVATIQAALVAHHALPVFGAELIVASQKLAVRQAQGGGHQTAHIDLGRVAKQHAVGVEHPDLAVGIKRTVDLAGARAGHAVERDGRGAGLLEDDGLARANVEAIPVKATLNKASKFTVLH